ncbi:MAG: metalloregulator ArsR/SmtB family transcription factor [Pseudomonadota bacterium]
MNARDTQNQALDIRESETDDVLWSAFADSSRRHMLDLLRAGPLTTSELCTHFEFTRFAVMKHLKILEQGGLVIVERRGRERLNHLNPLPIQSIYRRWIKPFEKIPADRMLRLKLIAEQNEENDHAQ